MARRGFLAEMQHQAKVSAREQERRQRAAVREQEAAQRRAEQARRAEERAVAAAARASEAERKRLEREAKAAHVAAMQAEAETMNAALAADNDDIDGLLLWTLDFDDFVDLEALKRVVEHPPFDRADLEQPILPPPPIPDPPEPTMGSIEQPKGLIGRKKKLAEATAAAEHELARATRSWEAELERLPGRRAKAVEDHAAREAQRVEALGAERERYEQECASREREVAEHNAEVDALIANLGYGDPDAVEEYVGIVLSDSVYPDCFLVDHESSFEPSTAELRLRVAIPSPDALSAVKSYKYNRAQDEITATNLSQKALKDRYSGAVNQVALRTLHEVFEADRRELIKTIGLEVGTETADPATGQHAFIPLAAVTAERDSFLEIDLSGVVPAATLQHLGAAVSKNPFALAAADVSGVRRT